MPFKAHIYNGDAYRVTKEMKEDFDNDGYLLVKGMLSTSEVNHVERALKEGPFSDHTFAVGDGQGKEAQVILWRHPGVDVTGMVGRCEKIVETSEQLLGGEVYHYYSKLMKKNAGTGGSIVWHQDYGYWYNNGCLFPDRMLVSFTALDKCTRENGCLQVLKGSHKCGLIEHGFIGERQQRGADIARVEHIQKVCEHEYIEMDAGDTIFFISTLLHSSSANKSRDRRWAFLSVYNRADNDPVTKHFYPNYTPLQKVSNSSILECTDFTTMDGKEFLDVEKEYTAGRNVTES